MAFELESDSYHSEPTLFTTPSIPMDGRHPDPFQGGIISSGVMSIPPIITGIPSTRPTGPGPSGTLVNAHTTASSLPTSGGPIPATIYTLSFYTLDCSWVFKPVIGTLEFSFITQHSITSS